MGGTRPWWLAEGGGVAQGLGGGGWGGVVQGLGGGGGWHKALVVSGGGGWVAQGLGG